MICKWSNLIGLMTEGSLHIWMRYFCYSISDKCFFFYIMKFNFKIWMGKRLYTTQVAKKLKNETKVGESYVLSPPWKLLPAFFLVVDLPTCAVVKQGVHRCFLRPRSHWIFWHGGLKKVHGVRNPLFKGPLEPYPHVLLVVILLSRSSWILGWILGWLWSIIIVE